MKKFLAAIVAALVLTPALATAGTCEDPEPRRLTVVGDSITARYNNIPGDPNEGWWSMVGTAMGYETTKVAMSGVGFLRKQPDCNGTRFGGLLRDVIASEPDIIIVAGGRNDWRDCASGAHQSRAVVSDTIFRYFRALDARLDDMGLYPNAVYMMSPWGAAASSHMWIRGEVKRQGEKFGFTWISTSYLQDGHGWTSDRTHPTLAGNVELARRALKFSNLETR